MKQLRRALAVLLVCAFVVTALPSTAFIKASTTASRVNLFTGSKEGSCWTQVLTFDTTNSYGGTLDPSIITEGGYFEATVTGDPTGLQMIFQSWTGGAGWAIVEASEVVVSADSTKLVRFTYDDIVAQYGTEISLLNRVYLNTTTGAIVLKSLDYVVGEDENAPSEPSKEPEETVEPSQSTEPEVSIEPSQSTEPEVSIEPSQSTEPEISIEPSQSTEPEVSIEPSQSTEPEVSIEPSQSTEPEVSIEPIEGAINLYTGSTVVAGGTQGGRFSTLKCGGVLDGSIINEDGYFAISYTGSNTLQLVFSSWSGGEGWATVGSTVVMRNGYQNYTALFDYDTVAAVYGTNFAALDAIYIMNNGTKDLTFTSFDYIPSGVEEALQKALPSIAPTVEPSYVAGELAERNYKASEEYVKVLGRTYVDAEDTRWFTNTASGIEYTFTGTKASITMKTSAIEDEGNQARFAVYVNNVLTNDVMMDEFEKTVDIFSYDEAKAVTIRIIKLSESPFAPCGISNINVVSTADIEATAARAKKIEFIGDSITCGYGVDDENVSGGFKTATENGSKTYAYKTAEALGADFSMVACSGFGIISGYTSSELNSLQTIPQYYDNIGFSWYPFPDNTNSTDIAWDFAKFQPDVVVVNLGTNDNSYCGSNESRKAEYVEGYVDFLKDIRAKNPNATIFCTLGIMGQELFPQIEEAVAQYTAETNDTNITSFEFDVQQVSDTICVDWHPSEKTHQKAANALTDYINYVMGW